MMKSQSSDLELIKSAFTIESGRSSMSSIWLWLEKMRSLSRVNVERVPVHKLRNWNVNPLTGNIEHASGKFFAVGGIHVETNWRGPSEWEQPIIIQPEIGYLGIIAQKHDGLLHFLMQAKIEPGNVNSVQISPTLQATKSNYTQVHNGGRPLFLDYFNGERPVSILLDQLQSEQGARFLRKRNRNMIVEISELEILKFPENFFWMTVAQVKELMKSDNLVNMDTRTVLSGIPFSRCVKETVLPDVPSAFHSDRGRAMLDSAFNIDRNLNSFGQIISWITDLKCKYELRVIPRPLNKIKDWHYNGSDFIHNTGKYFSVIGVHVEISGREVAIWDQPMVKPSQEGLIAFLIRKINGVYHFLVQGKLESGNFDVIELAPTVQCLTGNYRTGFNEYSIPFIDEVLHAHPKSVWYSALQSEEGGRFFREENKNMIVEVSETFPIEIPENYCWMTLNQLSSFILFNNYVNIAARSLLSAIRF